MSIHTQPVAPSRLAAALAYRPTTARCRDCGRRKRYELMCANNRVCKACWRRHCGWYRYQRNRRVS